MGHYMSKGMIFLPIISLILHLCDSHSQTILSDAVGTCYKILPSVY